MIVNYFVDMWHLALQGNKQGLFFYGSIYLLLACGYSAVLQMKVRGWPSTRGNLIGANVKGGAVDRGTSDQSFMNKVLYEYTVDGTKYKGNRLSMVIIMVSYNLRFVLKKQLEGIIKNDDGSVVVFYNPNNPQKSYLIQPGFIFIAFTWAAIILPAFFYWLAYHG